MAKKIKTIADLQQRKKALKRLIIFAVFLNIYFLFLAPVHLHSPWAPFIGAGALVFFIINFIINHRELAKSVE